jgi:large subunit ribosomal protein L21
MYAIIRTGGKQTKVRAGDIVEVERLKGAEGDVSFQPVLIVDESGRTLSGRAALEGAVVNARILGESRGPKIDIFTYKNKSGNRRRMGHRQTYTTIEVTGIELPAAAKPKPARASKAAKAAPAPTETPGAAGTVAAAEEE